ncbi:MAG: hypothetical protein ABGY71_07390 [bacterium]|nr:hypothetical protein [Planctomycetota bacterium]HIL52985.1 hypothetical protein [Planctomycetota bacterium]
MSRAADRFGQALAGIEEHLDWPLLGKLYCHTGGAEFFPPEQVEAQRDAGLKIAAELAQRLQPGGRSLYIGAALGELPQILCEALILEREVVALNLDNAESQELNRALSLVADACGFGLPRIGCESITDCKGEFDHGWLVSVLNDPEAFPALHDDLYSRSGDLATGSGDLAADRQRADDLVDAWLTRLADGARLTTSEEELALVQARVAVRGWQLEFDSLAILSAVVGDPIRFGVLQHLG